MNDKRKRMKFPLGNVAIVQTNSDPYIGGSHLRGTNFGHVIGQKFAFTFSF